MAKKTEKRFKVWIHIEEQTNVKDGLGEGLDDVTYEDLEETMSAGTFLTEDEACKHMDYLNAMYMTSGNA